MQLPSRANLIHSLPSRENVIHSVVTFGLPPVPLVLSLHLTPPMPASVVSVRAAVVSVVLMPSLDLFDDDPGGER